jgi:hypothetical protein
MNIEELGRKAIQRIKLEWGLPKRGFVAGGSIANIIWELVSGNKAVVNDIDIFVFEKELDSINQDSDSLFKYEERDIRYYEDYTGMCFTSYTKDFYTISESTRNDIFNEITYQANTTEPSLILKSFDINATRVGYSIEEDKVYWDKEFENFLKNGKLQISNLMTPSHTATRIVKKSKELNVDLDPFELNLIQYSLHYRFSDIIKLRFKERYLEMYQQNSDILDKYFILCRDKDTEKYILEKFGNKTELHYLKSIENKDYDKFDVFNNRRPDVFSEDNNLNRIFLSDIFLFYMRNIYGDEKKVNLWSKLDFFFGDPNYFDKEVSVDDIDLLERFAKNAPDSIENLKGYKLSEQISIIKKFLNKYKDDPIVAISILEKVKVDKDIELDEKTSLLLELSVRKEIVNDTRGKVKKIIKEIDEEDSLNNQDFWDLLNL